MPTPKLTNLWLQKDGAFLPTLRVDFDNDRHHALMLEDASVSGVAKALHLLAHQIEADPHLAENQRSTFATDSDAG